MSNQPSNAARPGAKFRHLKRGTTYTVVGLATLQTQAPAGDEAELVIYVSQDGTLWARPSSEFLDGRFEELNPSNI